MQSVSIPGKGSISVNQYQWTEPSKTTWPGGVTQNRSLDGLLQLQDLQVNTPGQQTLLQVTNTWGKVQDLQAQSRTDTASSTGSTPISSTTSRNFAYDDEVRLTRVQTTAPSSDSQTYTLDALGNRIAHSRVSGAWTYDANNRLTQRGSGAGATSYQYDNAGNLTQKTEADATTTYRYDTQNRLIEVALAQAGAIEQVIARYGYDPQDRRIWKEQYASKTGEPLFMAQRTLYLYSDQGLLAEATQPFVLDPRLTATTVDAPQPGVIAGPGPVITGPLPLSMVGGVVGAPMVMGSGVVSGASSVGGTSSNSAIRMASVPAAVPVAIQAASASPRALSADGGEAINIGPAAPAITTQYGLRPGSPWGTAPLFIQTKNSAGQTSMAYYHHDQLGTPLQATDKAGNIVWAASFDAFGRASITTPQATVDRPTIASNLRLPGQYEDVETGLHYNWHRYYDAEVGRYVTSDPIGLEGGINTYSYVDGNPLSFTDPEGLIPKDKWYGYRGDKGFQNWWHKEKQKGGAWWGSDEPGFDPLKPNDIPNKGICDTLYEDYKSRRGYSGGGSSGGRGGRGGRGAGGGRGNE